MGVCVARKIEPHPCPSNAKFFTLEELIDKAFIRVIVVVCLECRNYLWAWWQASHVKCKTSDQPTFFRNWSKLKGFIRMCRHDPTINGRINNHWFLSANRRWRLPNRRNICPVLLLWNRVWQFTALLYPSTKYDLFTA